MCFDNVEAITLAHKQYQDDEYDQTSLTIMDKPIDFEEAPAAYCL